MAKKGNRLREFEKNHRVLDISTAQAERQKKRVKTKEKKVQENNDGKKKIRISWVKITGLVICTIFIFVVGISVKNIYDLKGRQASLEEENHKLQQEKEELSMELENINSDEYIEEKARRELKLIKSNELVFYFPDHFYLETEKKNGEEQGSRDTKSDTDNTQDTAQNKTEEKESSN